MPPQIAAPPVPATPTNVLGCGKPRVEIWTRGLAARVLELDDLTSVKWSRVLGDTSEATVTVSGQSIAADATCCALLQNVRCWKHELVIYRDDGSVWSGPIVNIDDQAETVEFKARDLSSWLDRRFVHLTHIYGGQGANQGATDTTVIFTDLVTDAMSPDTSPGLALSLDLPSGVLAQGNYTPASFKTVGPTIRELAKGSIDWYVLRRTLYYTGGGASSSGGGGGGGGSVTPIDVTATCFANPGFETNTAGWSITPGGTTITRDTGQFHAGVASGKALGTAGVSADMLLAVTLTNLIIGKSYSLAGWVLGAAPAFTGGQKFSMSIAGVTSSDIGYAAFKAAPMVWIKSNVNFIAKATTHALTIRGNTGIQSSPYWVDDFTLILNNPDAPPAPPPVAPPAPAPTVVAFYLDDDDLATPAKVTQAGLDQETRSVVTDQQTGGDVAVYGEAPSPPWDLNTTGPGLTPEQVEFGLLEGVTTATGQDASAANSQATQRSVLLSDTPIVVTGFILSRTAGVTMDQLIPGSLVGVRLDRPCLSVRQTMLLRKVDVDTTPTSEQVTLTLEPASAS